MAAGHPWYEDLHAIVRTAATYAVLPPWTVFWSTVGLAGCGMDRARSVARVWVARGFFNPGLLSIAGIRVEVAGLDHLVPGHPYLYASNHQGHLDIPALVCALPTAVTFIAKVEIFKVPLFGRCLLEAGHIPVIRPGHDGGGPRPPPNPPGHSGHDARRRPAAEWTAEQMIEEAIRREQLGDWLVIFPEGTRTSSGEIAPFKSGMAAIARGAGVPVVPVCIHGSDKAYGRRQHLLRPGVIRVSVGEPVAADDPDLTAKVRDRIIALQPQVMAGGPEFRPADGVLEGALRCEERRYPGSGEAPNPMLAVFAPGPRRLVFIGVERRLAGGAGIRALARYHRDRGDALALVETTGGALGQARRLAAEEALRLDEAVCYADSSADVPLLEAVRHPVVVSPGFRMERLARARGWPMMQIN